MDKITRSQNSYQIILLQNEEVGEPSWNDVRRPSVHSADAEEGDLAEDGPLTEGDQDLATVYTAKYLDLSYKLKDMHFYLYS
jgi:hypothetical protein